MRAVPSPADDSPLPILGLLGALAALAVASIAVPIVGFVALVAVVYLGGALLAFVLVRMIVKFLAENLGERGVLTAWRPGVFGGVRVAIVVLALWAPFGVASVLVFSANGLVVHALGGLVTRTVDGMQADLGARDAELGAWEREVRGALTYLPLPGKSTLEDALAGVRPGMRDARTALVNLLELLRVALVVESYVAWIFLLWLTVRSALYFLARSVLADHLKRSADGTGVDVQFDMGLLSAFRGEGARESAREGTREGAP
jgi:hypothetical protein